MRTSERALRISTSSGWGPRSGSTSEWSGVRPAALSLVLEGWAKADIVSYSASRRLAGWLAGLVYPREGVEWRGEAGEGKASACDKSLSRGAKCCSRI